MDKSLLIAFPTYKRAADVKTFKYFAPGETLAFVEPKELEDYVAKNPGQRFSLYPDNGWYISQKRKWITDYAIKHKYQWLLMLEDDLTGVYVRDGFTDGGSPRLSRSTTDTVVKMMLDCAKKNGLTELGLSQQQSNHYYEEPEYKVSCKITEFCLFNLPDLHSASITYDPNIKQFEDFDISIQILLKGKKAALYIPAAFGHVTMGTNAGGHQADGKRVQEVSDPVNYLVRKYPGYVSRKEGRLFPEPKVEWTKLRWRAEHAKELRNQWL